MTRYHFPDTYMTLDDGRYFVKAKVAGVRQEAVSRCREDEPLALVRDRGNAHDPNAIKVFADEGCIGFVPSDFNPAFAAMMDSGQSVEAEIEAFVGGGSEKPKGVVIRLYFPPGVNVKPDDCVDDADLDGDVEQSKSSRLRFPGNGEEFNGSTQGTMKEEGRFTKNIGGIIAAVPLGGLAIYGLASGATFDEMVAWYFILFAICFVVFGGIYVVQSWMK